MNFIKKEGEKIQHINQIVAEDCQHTLRQELLRLGKINRELEADYRNEGAYLLIKDVKFPNVSYAFRANTLEQIEMGFNSFMREFLSTLPSKCHVSFRQPITIEQEDNHYDFYTRIAVVTL